MKKGKLITLEGGEGAGKTTALKSICEVLDHWGIEYICTREPGGDKIAEKIRDILLNSEYLHPKTELLLMFASRNEHIENVINPSLNQGLWVISDRYVDASYAYQGGGRELGFECVKWLDEFIVANTQADLTILMDIEPEIGMQRVHSRGQTDRIEKESMSFFRKIAKAYRQRAKLTPAKYAVIDASQTIENVKIDLLKSLEKHKQRLL